jgi:acetamidase/formamidase
MIFGRLGGIVAAGWGRSPQFTDDRIGFVCFASIVIPAGPFWGGIGMAPPPSMGRIPAGPPGVHGGNMDNRTKLR